LKDIASASTGPSATPTPSRSNPTATPTRTTGSSSPTPGRGATATIGRDLATPPRGNTPTVSATIVRTTPTSAQRYSAAVEKEFMDGCTGVGQATSVCRCMLDILEARFTLAQYREFEQAITNNERQVEFNGIINACVR
jgi:hypothetical protein